MISTAARWMPAALLAVTVIGCGRLTTRPKPSDGPSSSAIADAPPRPAGGLAPLDAADGREDADEVAEVRSIPLEGGSSITLRPVGAALIELTLEAATADSGSWRRVEIERRRAPAADAGETTQRDAFERPPAGSRDRGWKRRLHAAVSGATYAYRARSAGAWSTEVTVRAPAPSGPPGAPRSVRVDAVTPFAARIAWDAETRGVAGFEVLARPSDAPDFTRVALLGPEARELVHHMRVPGERLDYRVRAFNGRGPSAAVAGAAFTMPTGPDPTSRDARAMGPCVAPVRAPPKSAGCNPSVETLDDGTGHAVTNAPSAGDGCRRRLLGTYAGCTRELGVFELQADVVAVPGHADEGFPLLRAVAGAGQYVGARVQTLRFARGRYVVADEAALCGENDPDDTAPTTGTVDDDVTRSSPPFAACQWGPTPW